MAAILAEIDVEDLGTAKVREFRDALSDLLSVQQQVASASGGLAGGLAGSISALGSVNQASRTAAEGLAQAATATDSLTDLSRAAATEQVALAAAINGPNGPTGALRALIDAIKEEATAMAVAQQNTRDLFVAAQALGAEMAANKTLTADSAAALREFADLARTSGEFTAEQVQQLDALNAKLAAGIPLTEQEVAAYNELVSVWGKANAETLGLASATEQLLAQQREAEALARNTAMAFGVLASQLREGVEVSQLQKDALAELTTAAQGLAGISETDRAALEALNDAIQEGTVITPQHAAEIERLRGVLETAAGATRENVSAIQELIAAQQQAIQMDQQRAQAGQALEAALQEGEEVTEQSKRALDEFNRSVQESGKFSQSTRETLEGLSYVLDVGARVSGKHYGALQSVTAETRRVAEESTNASRGVRAFSDSTATAAVAMAALAGGAYAFLRSAGDIASRVEVLGTVMEVTAKNAHLSTVEMAAQEERIKSLGITTSRARQAVLDFVQAELNLTDASKIARAAQDLAVVAAVDSSEAFSRLTTAIQIQQPRLLRQFGIMTTLDQIYRQYAVSVGKTVAQLDTLDKRQAFVNKILEEGQKVAGAYEASMGDVGKQIGSLARLNEEARRAIGENLLPVMRLFVAMISDSLQAFNQMDPAVRRTVTALLTMAAAMATLLGLLVGAKFLNSLKIFSGLTTAVQSLRQAWQAATVAAAAHSSVSMAGLYGGTLQGAVGLLTRIRQGWQAATLAAVAHGVASKAGLGTVVVSATQTVQQLRTIQRTMGAATAAQIAFGTASVQASRAGSAAMAALRTAAAGVVAVVGRLWALIVAHPLLALAAAIALAAGAFVKFGESGKRAAEEVRERYGKVLAEINKVKDAATALAAAANRAQQAERLPAGPVYEQIRAEATAAYLKQLDLVREKFPQLEAGLQRQGQKWGVLASAVKAATAELEAEARTIREDTIRAHAEAEKTLAAAQRALNDLKREVVTTASTMEQATEHAQALYDSIKQNTQAADISTSVWEDLATSFKNNVIIEWLRLKAAIEGVWNFIVNLPKKLAEVTRALAESGAIPPGYRRALEIIAGVLDAIGAKIPTFDDMRVSIHAAARSSEDLLNQLDPKRYDASVKAAQRLRDQYRGQRDELATLIEEMDRETNATDRLADARAAAVEKLGLTGEDAQKQRQLILDAGMAAELAIIEAAGGVKKTVASAYTDLFFDVPVPDVAAVGRALSAIETGLEKHAKAQERARKKAEAEAERYKEAVQGFLGVDEGFERNLRALEEALSKVVPGTDAYRAVLLRGASVLEKFNLLTDEQKAKLGDLARVTNAAAVVAMENYAEAMRVARQESMETITAVQQLGTEIQGALSRDFADDAIAGQTRLRDMTRELNDMIEADTRDLYESLHVAQMDEVDQAIYQEKRRVDEIIKAAEREKQARLDVIAEEKRIARERANNARAELLEAIRNIQVRRDLELTALQARFDAAVRFGTAEQQVAARNALEIARAEAAFQDERLMAIYNAQEKIITATENRRNEEIKGEERLVREMNAQRDKMTAAQVAGSKVVVAQIKIAYDQIRNLGINVMKGVVSAFLQGFFQMIEGAKSFKDVLIGIWQSIKNAVFNFLEQMLQKWLDNLLKMAAAQKAQQMAQQSMAGLGWAGGFGAVPGQQGGLFGAGMTTGQKAMAGGLIGGVVGGTVGFTTGYNTGSSATGAFAGAASGAATGALFGGLPGALIGGAAGLIGGLFGAGKAKREAEELRKEFIAMAGGLENLKEKAREAGVSIERMLDIDQPDKLRKEIERIEKALQLREAKEGIAKTYTELITLRRQIQLAGGDIQKLYRARTVEEFNAEQEKLNKLLEAQQRRLQGLGTAIQGLTARLQGEALTLQKAFEDIFPDEDDLQEFFEAFAEARKKGFEGTAADFGRIEMEEFDLDEEDIAKIQAVIERTQETLNRLALVATATFAGILQETGDIVQAINAVSPALDQIIAIQDQLGIAASDAIKPLLEFRQVIKDNEDLAISLSGTTQMLLGMADANRLNQELFSAFGADAVSIFEQLQARGVDINQTFLLMQPTLQALWEAQKEFGFQTDEATQALLDQAEAAGVVGAQQQSINQKILDVLTAIAVKLGADIPMAYIEAGQAASRFGSRARGEHEAVGQAISRHRDDLDGVAGAYRGAGDAAHEGLTGADQEMANVMARSKEMTQQIELYNQMLEAAATAAGTGLGPTQEEMEKVRQKTEAMRQDFDLYLAEMAAGSPEAAAMVELIRKRWEEAQQATKNADDQAKIYGDTLGTTGTIAEDAQAKVREAIGLAKGDIADATEKTKRWNLAFRDTGGEAAAGGGAVLRTLDQVDDALNNVISRTKESARWFLEWGDAAQDAAEDAEEAMTHTAEGSSPTGIKQVIVRLMEATALVRDFQRAFVMNAGEVERSATTIADALAVTREPVVPERTIIQLPEEVRPVESVDRPTSAEGSQTIVVQLDAKSEFTVQGTKATAREEWERLKPEAEAFLEHNTDQFGSKIAEAAARYSRRRA